MPTVSIAMATYNGAKYLREQFDSLAAQTRLPDELVISDDASTDGSAGIIQAFAGSAPFNVRVEHNATNIGYTPNFARAISLCSGNFIFLSDQDDVWLPHKIETVLQAAEKHPKAMLFANNQYAGDANLNHDGIGAVEHWEAAGKNADDFGVGCTMAIRREFLDLVLPIPRDALPYDNWIQHLAIALGLRHLIRESLQIHRRHDANVSTSLIDRPEKLSRSALTRRKVNADPRTEWPILINHYTSAAAALEQARDMLRSWGVADKAITETIRSRRIADALTRRLDGLRLSRLSRSAIIVRLLARGDYGYFSGWKSAIADLLR